MHNQEARASGYEAVAFDTMLWAGTSDYGILACMVVLSAGCFLLSDYGILACMVVLSAECFERLDRGFCCAQGKSETYMALVFYSSDRLVLASRRRNVWVMDLNPWLRYISRSKRRLRRLIL